MKQGIQNMYNIIKSTKTSDIYGPQESLINKLVKFQTNTQEYNTKGVPKLISSAKHLLSRKILDVDSDYSDYLSDNNLNTKNEVHYDNHIKNLFLSTIQYPIVFKKQNIDRFRIPKEKVNFKGLRNRISVYNPSDYFNNFLTNIFVSVMPTHLDVKSNSGENSSTVSISSKTTLKDNTETNYTNTIKIPNSDVYIATTPIKTTQYNNTINITTNESTFLTTFLPSYNNITLKPNEVENFTTVLTTQAPTSITSPLYNISMSDTSEITTEFLDSTKKTVITQSNIQSTIPLTTSKDDVATTVTTSTSYNITALPTSTIMESQTTAMLNETTIQTSVSTTGISSNNFTNTQTPFLTNQTKITNNTCNPVTYPEDCDRPHTWDTTSIGEFRDVHQLIRALKNLIPIP